MSGGVAGSGSRASGGPAPSTPGGVDGSGSRASGVHPPNHYSTPVSGSAESGVSPMQWTCSVCRMTFGGWRVLQQHLRRVSLCRAQMPIPATGDLPVLCECSCGQRFHSISSGSRHVSLLAQRADTHIASVKRRTSPSIWWTHCPSLPDTEWSISTSFASRQPAQPE